MGHTDDAYATMLLTMALSPNKEEYARPLGVAEFRRFEAAARASSYGSIGVSCVRLGNVYYWVQLFGK